MVFGVMALLVRWFKRSDWSLGWGRVTGFWLIDEDFLKEVWSGLEEQENRPRRKAF
jgi:hypothetical protein